MLLFRSATGEAWDSIMIDMARPRSILFQCVDSQTYDDVAAANMVTNQCGTNGSIVYFFTFIIIICQIFLNLFIAIIVDSFVAQTQASEFLVKSDDIEIFVEAWQEFDPDAKGYI